MDSSTLVQWGAIMVPTVIALGGVIFGYGKLKSSAVTKKDCEDKRIKCSQVESVSTKVDDLKQSFLDLDKQLSGMNTDIGEIKGYLKALSELRNKPTQ